MLKHNIWHVEHIKTIIITRQIYITFGLRNSKTANKITNILRTLKKAVSYLEKPGFFYKLVSYKKIVHGRVLIIKPKITAKIDALGI